MLQMYGLPLPLRDGLGRVEESIDGLLMPPGLR